MAKVEKKVNENGSVELRIKDNFKGGYRLFEVVRTTSGNQTILDGKYTCSWNDDIVYFKYINKEINNSWFEDRLEISSNGCSIVETFNVDISNDCIRFIDVMLDEKRFERIKFECFDELYSDELLEEFGSQFAMLDFLGFDISRLEMMSL